MKLQRVILGGVLAGAVFYAVSLLVWALFKFLPIVPLALAVPSQGLGRGWQIEHLVVSLVIGVLWGIGYGVYGERRPGGWLYGLVLYLVGTLPVFFAHFLLAPPPRSIIVYGAVVSLIGALLGGKVIAAVENRK